MLSGMLAMTCDALLVHSSPSWSEQRRALARDMTIG